MDVSPLTGSTGSPVAKAADATKITSDFNTFLKMLTTQMQNQDPLNPIDSSDYAVQLATFSGVEQQTRTNQLLDEMKGQFTMLGMAQLTSWIGKEARSDGPVWFNGSAAVTLAPKPAETADRVVLVVQNARGDTLARNDIPVENAAFDWRGLDATGIPLVPGAYNLTLESYREGDLIQLDPVEAWGRVIEVQSGVGGARLVMEGGGVRDTGQITALRSPE
jgi:flagellar basal-body rod modification protein FlgD